MRWASTRDRHRLFPDRFAVAFLLSGVAAAATEGPSPAHGSDPAAAPQSRPAIEDLLPHIDATYEKPLQTTWYTPRLGDRTDSSVKVFPYIGRKDVGGRWLRLKASVQDDDWIFVRVLQFLVDGETIAMEISPGQVDRDASGHGITETIDLADVDEVIRRVADGREVFVSFMGPHRREHHELSQEDLAHFRRILALYDLRDLPDAVEVEAQHKQHERKRMLAAIEAGPVMAGVGGVTTPVLIVESRVQPKFPKEARAKGAHGSVVAQAVVRKDGTVGEVQILSVPAEGVGFEEAVTEAVKQRRYKPATYEGQPVDCFLTVMIRFELL
jgi:TonB family protein